MGARAKIIDPWDDLPLGDVLVTEGALAAIHRAGETPECYTVLQEAGDWGEVCDDDWDANNEAVRTGGRILSVHRTGRGERIWIITEADRSVTTVLLPEEY